MRIAVFVLTLAVCSSVACAQDTTRLFDLVSSSVCTIVAIAGDGSAVNRGSGFILSDNGLLVTNAHVLAGLDRATVRCGGKQGDILGIRKYDQDVDLVVAATSGLDVRGLALSTVDDIRPGMQIYVFGSPFGLEGTISPGLASGLRSFRGKTYVQISAPISAGSSGGPVTDGRGMVIGVAVASLEMAQNINFAIPAAAIPQLPDVDMQLAELGGAPQPAPRQPVEPAELPERFAVSEAAEFRGHPFGSPCGEVAISEYQRKEALGGATGPVRFTRWYSGILEIDVNLNGVPATVFYDCDDRFGMIEAWYRILGHADAVADIARLLGAKYGAGHANPISEQEASNRGCRWNFSLPGSRKYRPSERTTWNVDERFQVDMIVCGGKSKQTFVYYGDPVLIDTVIRAEERAVDTDL